MTRLDIALDDRTGTVTVERCYDAEKAGHLVRRFRKAAAYEYLDGDGGTQSRTLKYGSTKSALSVRIYDRPDGPGAH
jgi:DNA relaxase NicK